MRIGYPGMTKTHLHLAGLVLMVLALVGFMLALAADWIAGKPSAGEWLDSSLASEYEVSAGREIDQ